MPTLNGQHGGDFFLPDNPFYVSRTGRKLNPVRVFVENPLHGVSQVQRASYRFRTLVVRRHPKGEERYVNPTFFQSWNVYRAVSQTIADVNVLDQHALECVVVAIDAEHISLNASSV